MGLESEIDLSMNEKKPEKIEKIQFNSISVISAETTSINSLINKTSSRRDCTVKDFMNSTAQN